VVKPKRIEILLEWQSGERRYLSEGFMAQRNPTSDTDTTAAIDSGA
jgi:hypothetical protein